MSDRTLHNERQRDYFEATDKPNMRARDTPYVRRQCAALLAFAGVRPGDRLLDVGCGHGRYTIPLAESGHDIEGLDLASGLLERLAAADRTGVVTHAADIADPPAALAGRFDAAIGFFTLHHLHDLAASFRGMAQLVRPGGTVAFLEPTATCPLFYLQIALTPGMTWEGDGGITRMRPAVLRSALAAAELREVAIRRYGLFPPALANRRRGPALEDRLARAVPAPLRPFTLVRARRA